MRRRRTTGNALTTRESELVAFGKRRRHERSALDVTMSPTSRRHGKLEMARDENGVLVLLEDGRPTVWMSDEARVQLLAMEASKGSKTHEGPNQRRVRGVSRGD